MNGTVRRAAAIILALIALVASVGSVLAHPLGNFTINHYAALRVGPASIDLDVVIDLAEIPAFETRRTLDPDGDGELTGPELRTAAVERCERLTAELTLTAAGGRLDITPSAVGLTFPTGVGGLPTMRLVCEYGALLPSPLVGPTVITFADASWPERIGWREIVVAGDGVTTAGAPPLAESVSARLTTYPDDLLDSPPDVRRVEFTATLGGPALAPWTAPDASPLHGQAKPGAEPNLPALPAAPAPSPDPTAVLGAAVPGGIPDEVSSLLAIRDLDPLGLLASLSLAALLGAAHALSPGHGKTVMAAYLVGSQGTGRHAVLLGLAVTASHTLGVLVLAVLVLSATQLVPPERLFPILIATSGLMFVALGGWMLRAQVRARARRRQPLGHQHGHVHAGDAMRDQAPGAAHDHPHPHDGASPAGHVHGDQTPEPDGGWHEHGGARHRHVVPGAVIGWRSLVTLGLAGGLVPSVSALILLLGALAAGRPAFGIVLVIAFGVGMAAVLAGVGLALVYARGLLERAPVRSRVSFDSVPLIASLVVIGAGVYVTLGAISPSL